MRCVNRRELASGGGGGGGGEDVEARVSPPHGADGGAAVVRVESPVSPARDGVEPPVDGMVNLGSPLRKRAHRAVTTPVADAEMADADERHIVVRRGRRVAPTCLFASAGGLHDPFGHIRHLSKKEFAFTNAEALVLSLFDDEQGEWWGTVRKCIEAVEFEGAWVCECLFETRAREVSAEYLAYIRAKLARLADGMLFDSASKAASLLSLMQRGIDREHLVVMVQLVIDEFPDGRVQPRVLGEWERVVNKTGVEKVGVVGGGSPEGIAAAGYVPLTDEHIAAMLTGGLTLHHKKTWRAVQLSFSNGGVQSKNTEAVMTDIHFPSAFVLRRDDMGRPDWLHGRTWHIAFEARCREKGGTYTAIMTVQSGWSGADAARTFCVYDSECDCTAG